LLLKPSTVLTALQSGGQIAMLQSQPYYTGQPPEHPSQFEKSPAPPDNFAEPPAYYISNWNTHVHAASALLFKAYF